MFTSRLLKPIRTIMAATLLAISILHSYAALPARAAPALSEECSYPLSKLSLRNKIVQVLGVQTARRILYALEQQQKSSTNYSLLGYHRLGRNGFSYLDPGSRYAFFWSTTMCPQEIHGAILDRYYSLRYNPMDADSVKLESVRYLGLPISDELPTPDGIGRFNGFEGGGIYWHPDIGAFAVYGEIYNLWASLGWERSWLGYPTSNELPTSDGAGRISQFQNGYIIWYPDQGATAIQGKAIVRLVINDLTSIKMTSRDDVVDELYVSCFGASGTKPLNYSSVPFSYGSFINSIWERQIKLKPTWHAYGLTLWDGHLNENDLAAIHCLLIEDDAHKTYFKLGNIIPGGVKAIIGAITENPKLAVEGTTQAISGIKNHGNQVVAAFRVVIERTPEGVTTQWIPLDDTFVNQADNSSAYMAGQGGGGAYALNLNIVSP
jgi:hypothetical protein